MEHELRTIGMNTALIRTLICMAILIPVAGIDLSWSHEGFAWGGHLGYLIFSVTGSLILLTIIAVNWRWAFRGGPFRGIQEFCNKTNNPKETMARIENAWKEGLAMRNCRICDEYFILFRKMAGVVVPMDEISGIHFVSGFRGAPGALWVHVYDKSPIMFSLRDRAGWAIEDYFRDNTDIPICAVEIAAKERASFAHVVGKINAQYRLVELQRRHFVIDYSSPFKLRNYRIFASLHRLLTSRAEFFEWRAWEIRETELENIKYKPQPIHIKMSLFDWICIGVIVLLYFLGENDMVPTIQNLAKGHSVLLLLIPLSLSLIYFLYIAITSGLKTENYTEVLISSTHSDGLTMTNIWARLILHSVFIVALLAALVGMVFIWNTPLFLYVAWVWFWIYYTFYSFRHGEPYIPRQSKIQRGGHF